MNSTIEPTIWEGCYDKQLKGIITRKSFAHPAKFSLGLVERILDHCLERGYLKRDQWVGDPFGGVATGGIVAAYRGLRWIGVELEEKFVTLARENIAMHARNLEVLGCPVPKIRQGDSRQFDRIVADVAGVVCSPPYAESLRGMATCGTDVDKSDRKCGPNSQQAMRADYGTADGQIGRLREGNVDAVITSPPYADSINSERCGIDFTKCKKDYPGRVYHEERVKGQQRHHENRLYGKTEGQIGALHAGPVDAVVTSPPWEKNSEGSRKASKFKNPAAALKCNRGHGASDAAVLAQAARDEQKVYGESEGQIGQLKGGNVDGIVTSPPYGGEVIHGRPSKMAVELHQGRQCATGLGEYGTAGGQIQGEKPETYWSAMRAVYAACYRAIRPAGVICCVVKDYVAKGKRVPLCDDTARLLEHCGFVVIERIHAMLVKETEHNDLFNGVTRSKKSRKSFFRRLAEKNGSPEINYEEIVIARKL